MILCRCSSQHRRFIRNNFFMSAFNKDTFIYLSLDIFFFCVQFWWLVLFCVVIAVLIYVVTAVFFCFFFSFFLQDLNVTRYTTKWKSCACNSTRNFQQFTNKSRRNAFRLWFVLLSLHVTTTTILFFVPFSVSNLSFIVYNVR